MERLFTGFERLPFINIMNKFGKKGWYWIAVKII